MALRHCLGQEVEKHPGLAGQLARWIDRVDRRLVGLPVSQQFNQAAFGQFRLYVQPWDQAQAEAGGNARR